MQINNCYNQAQVRKKEPYFKATIYYVDGATFEEKQKLLVDCYEVGNPIRSDFTIEEAAVNKSSAYTLSARDCVVSSIFNPETKKVNQNHLAPYQKTILSIDEVAETMFAHTQQLLGNSKIRLEGFLTAGEGYMRTDEDLKLFQMFENNFKKVSNILGMDYSVIAQRRDGQTQVDLISDAVADAHYVYVKDNEGKNLIENLSDFMDAFVIKILSPKDKLVIMGKDVTEGFRPLGFKSLRV